MAELLSTVRYTSTLQSFSPAGGITASPDSTVVEFPAGTRIEKQVYKVAGNLGTKNFIPSQEGFVGIDLLKIEVLTPNKSVVLKFNGDPTGMTLKPAPTPSGTAGKAFLVASATFSSLEMVNPDPAEIVIGVSAFEKSV